MLMCHLMFLQGLQFLYLQLKWVNNKYLFVIQKQVGMFVILSVRPYITLYIQFDCRLTHFVKINVIRFLVKMWNKISI